MSTISINLSKVSKREEGETSHLKSILLSSHWWGKLIPNNQMSNIDSGVSFQGPPPTSNYPNLDNQPGKLEAFEGGWQLPHLLSTIHTCSLLLILEITNLHALYIGNLAATWNTPEMRESRTYYNDLYPYLYFFSHYQIPNHTN